MVNRTPDQTDVINDREQYCQEASDSLAFAAADTKSRYDSKHKAIAPVSHHCRVDFVANLFQIEDAATPDSIADGSCIGNSARSLGRSRVPSRVPSRRTSTATAAGLDELVIYRGIDLPRKDFGNVDKMRGISDMLRNLSFSINERASKLARSEVVSPLGERDEKYLPAMSSDEDENESEDEDDEDDDDLA
ncbi:MAG: hypothetical protein Q9161_005699 [Pseudevernia consocians]